MLWLDWGKARVPELSLDGAVPASELPLQLGALLLAAVVIRSVVGAESSTSALLLFGVAAQSAVDGITHRAQLHCLDLRRNLQLVVSKQLDTVLTSHVALLEIGCDALVVDVSHLHELRLQQLPLGAELVDLREGALIALTGHHFKLLQRLQDEAQLLRLDHLLPLVLLIQSPQVTLSGHAIAQILLERLLHDFDVLDEGRQTGVHALGHLLEHLDAHLQVAGLLLGDVVLALH